MSDTPEKPDSSAVEKASGQSKRCPCLEEIDRLRLALETAADRMFDAGLNDAWADARTALKEDGE